MPFLGKKLSDLIEQDVQELKEMQVQERDTVEYKRDMYGDSDDEKREMLKDITSIANHRGGYIIIGIEESDEGIPTNIVGIEPSNHAERITGSCLTNIDRRIVGLAVEDISLSNGRVVVVISIPESLNAPHMVTYRGLNQFWKRHGRQKDKMTIDEIGEAFDKRLSNLNRLERFLFTRRAQILEKIGGQTQMVMSAAPSYLSGEKILDNQDKSLCQIIFNPPLLVGVIGGVSHSISCGQPYPTVNGLRADGSTPYHTEPSFDKYVEVFFNGYIDFGKAIERNAQYGTRLFGLDDTALIANFMMFVQAVYERYLPMMPVVVNFSILNAKDMWLVVSNPDEERKVKWQEQHLELGNFYADNISEKSKFLFKEICDRLWQSFNRKECNLVDNEGNFSVNK